MKSLAVLIQTESHQSGCHRAYFKLDGTHTHTRTHAKIQSQMAKKRTNEQAKEITIMTQTENAVFFCFLFVRVRNEMCFFLCHISVFLWAGGQLHTSTVGKTQKNNIKKMYTNSHKSYKTFKKRVTKKKSHVA